MTRPPPPRDVAFPSGFRSAVSYVLGSLAVLAFVAASLPANEADGRRTVAAATLGVGLLVVAAAWTFLPKLRAARDWRWHAGLAAAVYLLVGHYEAAVLGAAYDPWWRLLVSFLWGFAPFVLLS